MKTLVTASHEHGPLPNGDGGCFARLSCAGFCPGVTCAEWLNSLGEDHEKFGSLDVSNGQVRANWLRSFHHIAPLNREQAALAARRVELLKELAYVRRRLSKVAS